MGGRGGAGGDRAAFRTRTRTKKKKKQPQTSRAAPVVCPCTHKRVFPNKHARTISTGKPSTDPAPRKWSRPGPAFLIASRHRPASRPHRRRPFCLPRGAPPLGQRQRPHRVAAQNRPTTFLPPTPLPHHHPPSRLPCRPRLRREERGDARGSVNVVALKGGGERARTEIPHQASTSRCFAHLPPHFPRQRRHC